MRHSDHRKRRLFPWVIVMGILLITTLFILVFQLSRKPPSLSGTSRIRNVVIIVSDALQRDILSCYGGPAHTPNIDRLAREGTIFENAYCTAPCTLPSSMAMLTGNYSKTYLFHARVRHPRTAKSPHSKESLFYVPDGSTLLAEILDQRGWDCRARIGNKVVRRPNILQGFSVFTAKPPHWAERAVSLQKEIGFQVRSFHYRQMIPSLEFILSAPADTRIFHLEWILDPHCGYNPPPFFRQPLAELETRLPRPIEFYTTNHSRVLDKVLREDGFTVEEMEFLRRLYRAEVESMDERVGYMIAALERSGRLNDTLIVFTSDHGELLGPHKRIGHSNAFFQDLVKVPLIFRGPGILKARRINSRVTHLDFIPTLAELMAVELPEDTMGDSYAPLFRGATIPERTIYFDAISNNMAGRWTGWDAILEGSFKLEMNHGKTHPDITLYDIQSDPGESRNAARHFPDIVRRFRVRIARLREIIRQRLMKNATLLDGRVNLNEAAQEARKTLKSLGYL